MLIGLGPLSFVTQRLPHVDQKHVTISQHTSLSTGCHRSDLLNYSFLWKYTLIVVYLCLSFLLLEHVFNLVLVYWFSPCTPVFSTDKTDRHNIAEIFLKVALNIITLTFTLNLTSPFNWKKRNTSVLGGRGRLEWKREH